MPSRNTRLRGGPPSRVSSGVIAVEFALALLVLLPLAVAAGEFYRLSLSDQALARAAHVAALAAGRDPARCELAARDGFETVDTAIWLFDRDDDGNIGFVSGQGPDGSSGQEVRIDIVADDGDVSNGVVFDQPLCGVAGSMIRVRAVVPVRMPFGLRPIGRERVTWAVNQS